MSDEVVTYGEGGYDATKPDGNIMARRAALRSLEEVNLAAIREKIEQALAQLEQADANWATLTVAQRTAAMQFAVRVSAKLARLALGRLEAE